MKELLALLAGLAVLALAYWHIRPQVMEKPKPTHSTVDWESLGRAIENIEGRCVYGEMPEIQFTLYYCKED